LSTSRSMERHGRAVGIFPPVGQQLKESYHEDGHSRFRLGRAFAAPAMAQNFPNSYCQTCQ